MNEDFRPQNAQLFYDTQLSLHRYYKAITSLLEALENRSSIDKPLIPDSREIPNSIHNSLLDIQALQQKKMRLFNKEKSSFIEQTFFQPLLNATKDIKKPKTTINKPNKTPVRTNGIEPQKNMVYLKVNLTGDGKKTSAIEDKPLPPWRPNA